MPRPTPPATAGLPWRGPGPGRPDEPAAASGLAAAAARPRPADPQEVALRWRLLRRVHALRGARPGRDRRADLLGGRRPGSGEMTEQTRKHPPFRRGEVWSLRGGPIGMAARLRRRRGRHLDRFEARPRGAADRRGPLGRVGLPDRARAVGYGRASGSRPVECDVRMPDGRRWRTTAFGIEDESAGYHPRHTVWDWSAGVGATATAAPSAGTWSAASTIPPATVNGRSGSTASRTSPPPSASTPTSAASPSPRGAGSTSRPRPSAVPRRTSACSASATASRSAASAAHSPASSSPRASA